MDDLLQRALERRDALRKELEAVESFLHAYTTARVQKAEAKPKQRDLFSTPPSPRAIKRKAIESLLKEAESLILDAGRPLTRGQLLERLEDAGYRIEGADKSKVLGTNLWRSKRFYTIDKVGYWPKDVDIPPPFDKLSIRTDPSS